MTDKINWKVISQVQMNRRCYHSDIARPIQLSNDITLWAHQKSMYMCLPPDETRYVWKRKLHFNIEWMDGCSFARLSESAKFLSRNLERRSWEKSRQDEKRESKVYASEKYFWTPIYDSFQTICVSDTQFFIATKNRVPPYIDRSWDYCFNHQKQNENRNQLEGKAKK